MLTGSKHIGITVKPSDSQTSVSREQDQALVEEPRPWKSRVLIGAILGSEFGVFLALLSTLFQGEADPRQLTSRLVILFVALLALAILRRKAMPANSKN